MNTSPLHALRLNPGDDLYKALDSFTRERNIAAAAILTCVGSLQRTSIRLAGRKTGTCFEQKMEILALSGTLSNDGCHAHITMADGDGKTIGGHLLNESLVHTTAEIVIIEVAGTRFRRQLDESTGFRELIIDPAD
ncbi:PPC domain-containing DNA-binding protein [Sulfuriroseicoccus oceanibius]|uniref:DNA-binding protein n=1 Tax=Sulfuriroseicoccus oceanibius TaxID=2707525 RepID=A0A6B3L837_9BACT|nr:PPC domain-containing DNA-binding protein [Sulfuriroseicoccus oceanibius]QQL43903.1 DNA-binding protein [Sulfuriroseicoccus oceanibius]